MSSETARPWASRPTTRSLTASVSTTCCYCGVGCGILARKEASGGLVLEGDPHHPVNRGRLCSKGLHLLPTVTDRSDRLLYPELREARHLPRRQATWDEALDRVAAAFRSCMAAHGPDSVALYVSGQCLTEEYYLANKIAKGFLGTNNIDTNSRLCMSSAVAGYRLALGEDSVPCAYEDLDLADLYLVAGANPAWCHPILFRRMEERLQGPSKSARMIVVDPRRTQSAAIADLHLQIQPGTDITLLHALARRLIEIGAADEPFIRDHTEGFAELRERALARTLSEAAAICRIDEADIEVAAGWIAQSHGFVSLWAMGLNQSTVGVNKNLALINLHLVTGKIGKPGHGPFSLTGQPNAMGGREVGGLANLMSAHRDLSNPAHRDEVARFWGVASVPTSPGLSAGEMMQALGEGRLKVLWVICTNPLVSWPDLAQAERALRRAELVIVQDISRRSDTLEYADVVLPAAGWLEKEGTMTNSERRITHLAKVIDPPGQALPDGEILLRFAHKMGWQKWFAYESMADVYREHAELTRGTSIDISGLDYDRLKRGSVQWPVPGPEHPGTPRLFGDSRFCRPNGRAKIHAVADENASPPPSPALPLVLTTGRVRDQWHTMTRSGKVAKLRAHEPQARLDIHPHDAGQRHVGDGDLVSIRGEHGEVRLRARLCEDLKPGVVFLPMHWGRTLESSAVRANNLTSARWDPVSKEPDLKFAAVQIEPYRPPRRGIVVVGAGVAALAFVRAYRRDNREDDITIFSKEALPFYDRVRLPDVVEREAPWPTLALLDRGEAATLAVRVFYERSVVSIDRSGRRVRDELGEWHGYDTLVLATGSRAQWPTNIPKQQRGVHALRSYADAQAILASARTGRTVVIVGGGLVGIELGSVLRSKGINVHIVQRSAQLMSKQLDEVAAEILREELVDRDIHIHLLDQVALWKGEEWIDELTLASGKSFRDVTVIYATGTTPNVELASACGLAINRGIVVDAAMRSSDPDILALGEVAEFGGQLHGTTPAAEEQGRAAAQCLAGDVQAGYTGSVAENVLKVTGFKLASLGLARPPADDLSYQEIVFLDRAARVYKKCVVKSDRLVGALLVGDSQELLSLRALMRSGEELGPRRATLLRGNAPAATSGGGRLVCSCMSVDEGSIAQACTRGATSLARLMAETGAGTGCGSCRPELAALLSKHGGKVPNSIERVA
ncbi:MAG: molybdopterin-dependent oxidoreductase [Polyangia bacterium]